MRLLTQIAVRSIETSKPEKNSNRTPPALLLHRSNAISRRTGQFAFVSATRSTPITGGGPTGCRDVESLVPSGFPSRIFKAHLCRNDCALRRSATDTIMEVSKPFVFEI
jgi:hypothetical protein